MQRTRLNTLVELASFQLEQFFGNPWRRISVLLISLLLGFFAGQALSTTGGQQAQWDVVMAAFVLLFTESVSFLVYRFYRQRALFLQTLNLFKAGVIYGLFLEAFKLGS